MIQTILIGSASFILLIIVLYFMMKKINKQENLLKELEQKERKKNELEKLKEKIDTGNNSEQFNHTLDVLQELRKTDKRI